MNRVRSLEPHLLMMDAVFYFEEAFIRNIKGKEGY